MAPLGICRILCDPTSLTNSEFIQNELSQRKK